VLFPFAAALQHNLAGLVPPFAFCETPRPCSSNTARSKYIADVFSQVSALAAKVARSGSTPAVLHIGTHNFDNPARWTDHHLYEHVLTELKSVVGSPRLLLVEPMAYKAPQIMKNAAKLPIQMENVELLHTMVNGTCLKAQQMMYKFSSKIERDFNISTMMTDAWTRAERDQLIPTLHAFIRTQPSASPAFKRLAYSPEIESYIEEVAVPCMSPSMLLAQMGVSAESLVMVTIDAEGCDPFIVNKMVDLPGFRPAFFMFEGRAQDSSVNWVFPKLVQHGLLVGTKVGDEDKGSDTENIIAVPRAQILAHQGLDSLQHRTN